jgi:hypothetical protein
MSSAPPCGPMPGRSLSPFSRGWWSGHRALFCLGASSLTGTAGDGAVTATSVARSRAACRRGRWTSCSRRRGSFTESRTGQRGHGRRGSTARGRAESSASASRMVGSFSEDRPQRSAAFLAFAEEAARLLSAAWQQPTDGRRIRSQLVAAYGPAHRAEQLLRPVGVKAQGSCNLIEGFLGSWIKQLSFSPW